MRQRCRATVGARYANKQRAKKLDGGIRVTHVNCGGWLTGSDGATGNDSQGSEVGRRGMFVRARTIESCLPGARRGQQFHIYC